MSEHKNRTAAPEQSEALGRSRRESEVPDRSEFIAEHLSPTASFDHLPKQSTSLHVQQVQQQQAAGNQATQRLVQRLLKDGPALPAAGPQGGEVPEPIKERIDAARGGGRPLSKNERKPMEDSLDTSFEAVRIHENDSAGALSLLLGARAFTTGNDIFLSPMVSAPSSELIKHELTHVHQQRSMSGSGSLKVGSSDSPYEREADRAATDKGLGNKDTKSSTNKQIAGTSQNLVQREVDPLDYMSRISDVASLATVAKGVNMARSAGDAFAWGGKTIQGTADALKLGKQASLGTAGDMAGKGAAGFGVAKGVLDMGKGAYRLMNSLDDGEQNLNEEGKPVPGYFYDQDESILDMFEGGVDATTSAAGGWGGAVGSALSFGYSGTKLLTGLHDEHMQGRDRTLSKKESDAAGGSFVPGTAYNPADDSSGHFGWDDLW